ncbi:ribosomal protein, L44 [Nesidiocoris tenuis]|uniref:Large ribosomal subunit protein mL44 n=1 Tax=Nesidiocoris tenuis TaxID=355587 RepID=A0ABN7AZT2_9HEMI|nr:ribosomal protein, L44 [Nesidiocoris tenuis]
MQALRRSLLILRASSAASRLESRNFQKYVAPTYKAFLSKKKKMGRLADPHPRNTFAEWNYDAELYAFGQRLRENFEPEILKQALLDVSYLEKRKIEQEEVGIEPELNLEHNGEMANTGNRLMSLYVEQYLTTTIPKLPKKYIKNIRDHLISDDMHAHIGKQLGLSDLILCDEYPPTPEILVRAFRSVIQALAISSGADRACGLVRDLVVAQIAGQDLTLFCSPENPLKELEEHLKSTNQQPPEPRLISVIGQNFILSSYDVGVYSNKIMIGRGFGESAETAQNMACCDALWRAWDVTVRRKPISFKLELPPLEKFDVSVKTPSRPVVT